MQCPSCGALHSSEQCPDSTTAAATLSVTSEPALRSDQSDSDNFNIETSIDASPSASAEARPVSRLIEFPGVSRVSVPQWRKELSQRVREVQERRAREAALEEEEAEKRQKEQASASPPQLELLPHTDVPALNPIVAAALRRIERAHDSPTPRAPGSTSRAVATRPSRVANCGGETTRRNSTPTNALATDRVATSSRPSADTEAAPPNSAAAVAPALDNEIPPAPEPAAAPDRPNLVVVPSPAVVQTESPPDIPRPKRLIADNDPALGYLDSVATSVRIPVVPDGRAPMVSRITAALVDLLVVVFLSLPFAAILELQDGNWLDPRIAGLMGAIAAVVMFIYLTVSTALTGRTLGMRILSLRAIDTRTGLIPTGSQSAGRALVYILSLVTMGIGLLYALINDEGKTAHDRLSRTAVVRF